MGASPVRASDAEREQAMRALRHHYAAGRLDADELEERLAVATRARDRGELRAVLADLPGNRRTRSARAAARMDRAFLRAHATTWLAFSAVLVAAWGLSGAGAFWPAVVILPWGALVAGHAYCSRAARRLFRRLLGEPSTPRRLLR
jgi:hypothetical protein